MSGYPLSGNRAKRVNRTKDEEGRLLHRPLAEHVVNRISGQPAIVTSYNDKRESESAPLPFSLSALQIEAAKRFGLSAQNVFDICQKLYETHKLITYPRSDCRYLPEEHFAGRHAVMNAISVHAPDLFAASGRSRYTQPLLG